MFLNTLFKFLNHAVQKCWIKSGAATCMKQVKNMASEKRHIGLFGVAGILAAALIISGFMFAGNFLVFGKGILTIEIMDAPVDLQELWLTIDSVSVQKEDGTWVALELVLDEEETSFYFDLLKLQEHSEVLSQTEIPAGSYKMIKMRILDAIAVYPGESVEDADHLTVPSGELKVLLKPSLEIAGGEEETVLIDLQPIDISEIAISQSLNLRPVVKAVVSQ